jgi:hypothetical protein
MVGAGMESGLEGAPSRNHPIRGGLNVVEGTMRAYPRKCLFIDLNNTDRGVRQRQKPAPLNFRLFD